MKRTQGKCVFCNGHGLTKEHIWSDWLTNVLPPQNERMNQFIMRERTDLATMGVIISPEMHGERRKRMTQHKIRNVCKTCNSGWMSSIVRDAKPHIEGRILGTSSKIDETGQAAVSAWITIACMMAEFTDPRTAGISSGDFMRLCLTKKALDNWVIGLANYSGSEWYPTRYRHFGCKFLRTRQAEIKIVDSAIQKLQISTYTLGGVAVHAFSSTDPFIVSKFRETMTYRGVTQIWPVIQPVVDFGSFSTLNDDDLLSISDDTSFFKRI